MIAAGIILAEPNRSRLVGVASHIHEKISGINLVLALVPEQESATGAGIANVRQNQVKQPRSTQQAGVRKQLHSPAETAKPNQHRHRTNARHDLSLKRPESRHYSGPVGRALPNARTA